MADDPAGRQPPSASLSLGPLTAERRSDRSSAAPPVALAFALGAVALWATNAFVGKTLLANHPVSEVQFLQFSGAALVFALIRFFPSPLVIKGAGRIADAGVSSNISHPSRRSVPIHLVPQGDKGRTMRACAVGFIGLVGTMALQYIAFASMPVIEANLVAYTWPLMVAAAVIVLGRPRRPLLLGLTAALGFTGVALVISGEARMPGSEVAPSVIAPPSARHFAWPSTRLPSAALPCRRIGFCCLRP
ncbi:hypothetical protein [Mesorhizobium sp. M1A.F.Ca.IN.022.06.1.1]|uniref:hypothetical protein n=1 Tax=Mesorhizobium sp. M1A.F.Ca.IN.022.06.1.1 TaxID=2493680 RepID=UPI001FE0819E|nr:hypothetical protein [Mesorhizobium sp. M1A.F.Ca.IN.022.06.1.1]